MTQRQPQELNERAVRLLPSRKDHESEWTATETVATKLGIGSSQGNRGSGRLLVLGLSVHRRPCLSWSHSQLPLRQRGDEPDVEGGPRGAYGDVRG